jgi:hypothetical protein
MKAKIADSTNPSLTEPNASTDETAANTNPQQDTIAPVPHQNAIALVLPRNRERVVFQQNSLAQIPKRPNVVDIADARRRIALLDQAISPMFIDGDKLRFLSGGPGATVDAETNDTTYRVSGTAFDQVCRRAGAPASYLRTLDHDLRPALLNRHLEKEELSFGRRCKVLVKDQKEIVRFSDSDGLATLSGVDAFDSVIDGIGSDQPLAVHKLECGDDGYRLTLLGVEKQTEVVVGDAIQAGLVLDHSISGDHATTVETFILRLKCTNGLLYRECVEKRAARTRRRSEEDPQAHYLLKHQLHQFANMVWSRLEEKLAEMHSLPKIRTNVPSLLENAFRQSRLPLSVHRLALAAWQEQGEEDNLWAAINAITWLATHEPQIEDRIRTVLMSVAGIVAMSRLHVCPSCNRVLRH